MMVGSRESTMDCEKTPDSTSRLHKTLLIASAALALASCNGTPNKAPPRADDTIAIKPQTSLIAVPISADLDRLTAALEREIPRKLWSIDEPDQTCVASEKVQVLFVKL